MPQTFTLANGMKVYVVEENSLPVLSATMVSRAGSENNPVGKGGLASLTAQAMGEATDDRDLTKLAEDQERIGIRVFVGASMDGAIGRHDGADQPHDGRHGPVRRCRPASGVQRR